MDALTLRTILAGNSDHLDLVLRQSDTNIDNFLQKKRPALTLNAGNVKTDLTDIDALLKSVTGGSRTIGIKSSIPRDLAKQIQDLVAVLPQLKDKSATLTINRKGNADAKTLRDIANIATQLKDKTVTITVDYRQTGNPPGPLPPGGGPGPGPIPPGGGPNPNPNPGPRPIPWNNQIQGMQQRGYYSLASGAMMTGMITRPLMGLGEKALDFAGDYEESMQHVITLTDVAKSEIGSLKQQVVDLSADPLVRQGPTALGDALYYVTSTGLKGADGMTVLKAAAYGASTGMGEATVVANTLTTALDAYGLPAEKAIRLMDTMTQAVKYGKGEADQYAAAFPKVIALAAQAGVSFEEVAAQMASATRIGLTPNEAATAQRQIFSNLIDPSEKAKRAFKDLGTSVGEVRLMLSQKGLFNTLKDLSERTGGRIGPISELFGSIRGLTGFLATTGNATLAEYQKTLAGINAGDGSTLKAASTASETYRFALDKLNAAVERLGITTGTRLTPQMNAAAHFMETSLPNAAESVIKSWNGLDDNTKKIVASLAALILLAGPMKILAGNATILLSAFGGMAGTAVGGLGLIKLAEGVSALITAMRGLGAAGGLGGLLMGSGGVLTAAGTGLAGLAITLAALAPIFEAVAAAVYNYQAKLGDMDIAQSNAKASADSLQKTLAAAQKYAYTSSNAKSSLAKMAEDAKAAAGNAEQLLDLIKRATAEKVEIGKDMHISPLSKTLVQNELTRFIHALENQAIELKVSVGRIQAAEGIVTPQSHFEAAQAAWPERFKRAGVAMPVRPEPPKRREYHGEWVSNSELQSDEAKFSKDTAAYPQKLAEYQKQVVDARQRVIDIEKAAHDEARKNGAATVETTHAQTQAVTEQTKAVEKLSDAELRRERARLEKANSEGKLTIGGANFDPKLRDRAQEIEDETKTRKERIQEDWAKLKAKREELAAQAADDAARKAEETAERLRKIEAQAIAARLALWQSFGNAVETILSSTARIGAEDGNARKIAAQAQMARREFAEIPKPLRDIVVGLAAIGDQMDRLTKNRDQMRGMFGDMFKDALRNGGDTSAIAAQARLFEQRLDYERKMTTLENQRNRGAGTVLNEVESRREKDTSRKEALEEAGRKNGRTFEGEVYVDAAKSASMLAAARGHLGATGADAKASGAAYGKEWCVGFIQVAAKEAGMPPLAPDAKGRGTLSVSRLRDWGRQTGRIVHDPQPGDIMTIKNGEQSHAAIVSARNGNTVATIGGNEGHIKDNLKSMVKEGATYNINAPGVIFIRPASNAAISNTNAVANMTVKPASDGGKTYFETHLPPPIPGLPSLPDPSTSKAIPGVSPQSAVGRRIANTPHLPVKKGREFTAPPATERDGSLLPFQLPAGWGAPVTAFGLAKGETRDAQLKMQELMIDSKRVKELARDYGMTVDEFAAAMRELSKMQDANNATGAARDAARNAARDSAKSAYFARRGAQSPVSEFFYDAQQGDYNRTAPEDRRKKLNGMLDEVLANMQGAVNSAKSQQFDENKVRATGAPYLQRGEFENAEKARAMAQARVDAWNNPELKQARDAIAALEEQERNGKAAGTFEGTMQAWGAREKINQQQATHDTKFKELREIGEGKVNADYAEKSATAAMQRRQELEKSNSLLEFEVGLISEGVTSQAERTRLVEQEKDYREELDRLLKENPLSTPEQKTALETQARKFAADMAKGVADKGYIGNVDENTDADNASSLRRQMLQKQLGLAGSYRGDDPELAIQMRLAEEESRLKTENLSRDPNNQINVKERLGLIEQEIRLEDSLHRVQNQRQNDLQAETNLLDLQKEAQMALARTARERMEIEFRFQDKARAAKGETTSDEERATRQRELAQADKNEAQQRMIDLVDQTRSTLADGVYNGMRDGFGRAGVGVLRSFVEIMQRQLAESTAKALVKRFEPKPQTEGIDLTDFDPNFTPSFGKRPPAMFVPDPQKKAGMPTRGGAMGEAIKAATASKSIASATFHVMNATTHANMVTLNAKTTTGGGSSASGGAGSAPSGDQWGDLIYGAQTLLNT